MTQTALSPQQRATVNTTLTIAAAAELGAAIIGAVAKDHIVSNIDGVDYSQTNQLRQLVVAKLAGKFAHHTGGV